MTNNAGVVVVGAGQAGFSVVSRLRDGGYQGAITLCGDEPYLPYQRPPLSKAYLTGDMELDRLYLGPEEFYEAKQIALHLNDRASGIDVAAKTVTFVSGEVLSYSQLVLATGSTPRRLPETIAPDTDAVHVIRSVADVDALSEQFEPGKRLMIIGGGYIGLELASVARKRGIETVLVEAAERILQRVAAPETSTFFRDLHSGHGVTIREGMKLAGLVRDGGRWQASFDDGETISADLVACGIGIDPNTVLAADAGLKIENGIWTDELGRTSDVSIWAAGECASFEREGGRIRLESVGHAIDHGRCVADNIMGANKAYDAKPWFWSDQYDLKLQIAGLNTGYDRVVVREGADDTRSHWYYHGDRLLAVDAMNEPRTYMVAKRLIEAGKSPDAAIIADASVDLKSLL